MLIVFFIFSLRVAFCFSQTLKTIPLHLDKTDCIFGKIAWVSNNRFCIAFDNNRQNHVVFIFDSTGKVIHDPVVWESKYFCQDEYFLVLGTTVFFLYGGANNVDAHEFSITDMITPDGIDHHSLERIFYISHNKENKKLNEPAYSFRAYRGVNGQKALLTYNNDYKGLYKEGFRYRILSEDGKLSGEDTLNLPYPDVECNIDDVIYDDAEDCIYLLGDLFLFTNADKRAFKNSFIGSYSCKSKSYSEISTDIPSFYKNKIQHTGTNHSFAFTGLQIDETSSKNWSESFLVFRTNPLEIVHASSIHLKPESVTGFFDSNNKLQKEYILPVNFSLAKDSTYFVGWTRFFRLNQMEQKSNRVEIIGGAWALFGVIGAIAASAAIEGKARYKDLNPALWLSYSPEKKLLFENISSSSLRSKKYYAHSYASFLMQGVATSIMNKPLEEDNTLSSVSISKFSKGSYSVDSIAHSFLSDLHVNTIYPGSLFSDKNKNYFLGEYDPELDTMYHMNKVAHKYFLVEIE